MNRQRPKSAFGNFMVDSLDKKDGTSINTSTRSCVNKIEFFSNPTHVFFFWNPTIFR